MGKLSSVVNALLSGDADTVIRAFGANPPRVNAQVGSLVEGRAAVTQWVDDTASWFSGLKGSFHGGLDIEEARLVHDTSLTITTKDGEVDLPFVVVADRVPDGITELRTYHSTWPYTGAHVFRAPPVAKSDLSNVPKVFTDYINCLATSDVDPILAAFTADGYVREPSGDRWKFQGGAELFNFYKGHIAEAPPARFDLRTCTNSENVTAVEYAFAYGDKPMVGGICIMEHYDEKIAAVRITDDVGA